MNVREYIEERGIDEVVIFENPAYEDAFIGLSENDRAVYDFDKMVECLAEEENMTESEAVEFIEYNTIRSLPYIPNGPIILYRAEEIC